MFNENWYPEQQCKDLIGLYDNVINLEGDVIEIGCWEGKSTIQLANKCYPEILICNDTWLGNVQESIITGHLHPTEIICKQRDVFGVFTKNMDDNTQKNYSVIKRDCIEWLKEYSGKIKFIHIDASHEYESVYDTIQLVLPRMVSNGIICGDDFVNSNITRKDLHGGVERAVRESLPDFKNIGNLWYSFI